MSDRDLTTSKTTVFGPPPSKGTTCRVCGRDVDDGRATHCSDYCRTIANNVMSLLNWGGVRQRVLDRDDHTCRECGFKQEWLWRGTAHLVEIVTEKCPDEPVEPVPISEMSELGEDERRRRFELRQEWTVECTEIANRYFELPKYDDTWNPHSAHPASENVLEVDHITPISEGGHPFDPANLRTLCADCHEKKTVREHKERADHHRMDRPEIKLVEFVEGGDGSL